jgi:hypothetical protein
MWLLEPAPIQRTGCASSVRSMKTVATRGSGNGAGDPGEWASCRLRDLRGVGASVAGNQHDHRAPAAVEDERLDDLPEVASDDTRGGVGGRRSLCELLDTHFCPGLA